MQLLYRLAYAQMRPDPHDSKATIGETKEHCFRAESAEEAEAARVAFLKEGAVKIGDTLHHRTQIGDLLCIPVGDSEPLPNLLNPLPADYQLDS